MILSKILIFTFSTTAVPVQYDNETIASNTTLVIKENELLNSTSIMPALNTTVFDLDRAWLPQKGWRSKMYWYHLKQLRILATFQVSFNDTI